MTTSSRAAKTAPAKKATTKAATTKKAASNGKTDSILSELEKRDLPKPTTTPGVDISATGQINISRIATETIRVFLMGSTPLITNRFSEKAKQMMLDNMQGKKSPKQPKNPEAEYIAAAYRLDDGGYGLPAIAFKSCTVSAARFFGKSVTMVGLRQSLFFRGQLSMHEGMTLCPITSPKPDEPYMREDVVTLSNGGHDLRYRPCWTEWSTHVDVTYVTSLLTRDSVLSLIEAGGLGVGVGEWRPEKKGEMGTFHIDESKQIVVIKSEIES